MLTKVDMMSMANGLELRNPFLDYRLIEYAFTLESKYKIDAHGQKIILKQAFAHLLPQEMLNRKKHGFEVPLLKWFTHELKSRIEEKWLNNSPPLLYQMSNALAYKSLDFEFSLA